jgi:hypothetical protein
VGLACWARAVVGKLKIKKRNELGHGTRWAEFKHWIGKQIFELVQGFDFKIKRFKHFQIEFELNSKIG